LLSGIGFDVSFLSEIFDIFRAGHKASEEVFQKFAVLQKGSGYFG
jgi:hypothetical protein